MYVCAAAGCGGPNGLPHVSTACQLQQERSPDAGQSSTHEDDGKAFAFFISLAQGATQRELLNTNAGQIRAEGTNNTEAQGNRQWFGDQHLLPAHC